VKKKRRPAVVVKAVKDNRVKMMADRLAILLVICNARDGDDWNPWMGEKMYDGDDQLGDHLRKTSDYKTAKEIVRLWIEKQDKRTLEEFKDE
jgi:hypothetical protein